MDFRERETENTRKEEGNIFKNVLFAQHMVTTTNKRGNFLINKRFYKLVSTKKVVHFYFIKYISSIYLG